MAPFLFGLFTWFGTFFRSRYNLSLEIIALRQQLGVLKRKTPRPRLKKRDRMFWILLRRIWPLWSNALIVVKPETVVAWHRAGFRLIWRIRSRTKSIGRPTIDAEVRAIIRQRVRGILPGERREFTVNFSSLDFMSPNALFLAISVACLLPSGSASSGPRFCAIIETSSRLISDNYTSLACMQK
jgi:hypothetical protein